MISVLALETSTRACSVALLRGAELHQQHRVAARQHNRIVLRMIDELLSRVQLTVSNLDVIAFSAGPGSFTGLRIGAAIAQGLSAPFDTPLVAVPTLAVLALTGLRKAQETDSRNYPGVITLLQSKPGEVYFGAYRMNWQTGRIQSLSKNCVLTHDEVEIPCQCRDWLLVGEPLNLPPTRSLDALPEVLPQAGVLAELAVQYFRDGKFNAAQPCDLVYPRGTAPWKKQPPAGEQAGSGGCRD